MAATQPLGAQFLCGSIGTKGTRGGGDPKFDRPFYSMFSGDVSDACSQNNDPWTEWSRNTSEFLE